MTFSIRIGRIYRNSANQIYKNFYRQCSTQIKKGVIVGVYTSDGGNYKLTEAATAINKRTSDQLLNSLKYGSELKAGKCRVLYSGEEVVGIVGLGEQKTKQQDIEERDLAKETVRSAVAAGVKELSNLEIDSIKVDSCGDEEAAAEGALLSAFKYQDHKTKKKTIPELSLYGKNNEKWNRGVILGEGQNIARKLMETPSNILTPTQFAQEAVNHLENLGVEVLTRGYEWAAERGMNAFLSVTSGSAQPPIFLELTYKGAKNLEDKPVAIVGKGVTFDTGGISLKPPGNMDKMRADMGGAACTVGAIYSAAKLKIPINLKGFIPLCENMPGSKATRPGDIVKASNGKTIQIDNTDAEGRLILADALHYASQFNPRFMIDMATLTGAIAVALGSGAAGVFTNSTQLWDLIKQAGYKSGDRVWRMPLWDHYSKQIKEFGNADLNNIGKFSRDGGSCTAAAFLKEFVTCDDWAHIDIAGVMENNDEVPFLCKGMSGRPTRTIVGLIELMKHK